MQRMFVIVLLEPQEPQIVLGYDNLRHIQKQLGKEHFDIKAKRIIEYIFCFYYLDNQPVSLIKNRSHEPNQWLEPNKMDSNSKVEQFLEKSVKIILINSVWTKLDLQNLNQYN